jgi:hypothetical protein
MLVVVAAGLLFLSTRSALAAVRVFSVVESGQQPLVETDADGKPLSGVPIRVYRGFRLQDGFPSDPPPMLVLTSNDRGQVILPRLQDGDYLLVARSHAGLGDYAYLHISSDSARAPAIHLSLAPMAPTFEEKLAEAEAAANPATVNQLRGIVTDRSGAAVWNAAIDVLVKGTQGKQHAARLRADKSGRFSADLPEGQYVVFVLSPGFQVAVVPVTVSKAGTSDELAILLEIGQSN